jgi:hypothetical protein
MEFENVRHLCSFNGCATLLREKLGSVLLSHPFIKSSIKVEKQKKKERKKIFGKIV